MSTATLMPPTCREGKAPTPSEWCATAPDQTSRREEFRCLFYDFVQDRDDAADLLFGCIYDGDQSSALACADIEISFDKWFAEKWRTGAVDVYRPAKAKKAG